MSACERLVVFGSDPLGVDDLPSSLLGGGRAAAETGLIRLPPVPTMELKDFRVQCEKEYVEHVLKRTRWNVTRAARLLGLQRTYLHQKIAALEIRRPQAFEDEDV